MHFRCSYEADVPVWYDLDVLDGGRGLVLKIEKGAAEQLFEYLTAKTANRFMSGVKVPTFIMPGILPWGYGPVLVMGGQEGPWVRIECDLPALFSDIKADTYTSEERWDRAYGLSATWSLLMAGLGQIGSIYMSPLDGLQLLEVELGVNKERGMHSCPILAGLSVTTLDWLRGQGEERRHRVIGACMLEAHHRMRQYDRSDDWVNGRTYAMIRQPARIDFGCDGDACGLNPSHDYGYDLRHQKGYELFPHNVDTPMQQMVLLVGIAALNCLVRKDMAGA